MGDAVQFVPRSTFEAAMAAAAARFGGGHPARMTAVAAFLRRQLGFEVCRPPVKRRWFPARSVTNGQHPTAGPSHGVGSGVGTRAMTPVDGEESLGAPPVLAER